MSFYLARAPLLLLLLLLWLANWTLNRFNAGADNTPHPTPLLPALRTLRCSRQQLLALRLLFLSRCGQCNRFYSPPLLLLLLLLLLLWLLKIG